jgi:TetR/AcrR family transcriptional regulator, regulator of biofilm formation and stress response
VTVEGRGQRESARRRRAALLRAASELAAEVGAGSVTHRAVAARAGVPLSTTSYFFSSIDELVTEALRTSADGHVDGLDDVGRTVPAGHVDAATAIRDAVAQTVGQERTLAWSQVEYLLAAGRQPELRPCATAAVARIIQRVCDQLEATGAVQAEPVAWAIVALGDGAMLHRIAQIDLDHATRLEDGMRLLVAVAQLTDDEVDELLSRYTAPLPAEGSPPPRR